MLEPQDIRSLVDLGFIALMRGHDRHAAAIFDGVQALRPEQEAGFLGGALVQLQRGEVAAAIASLRRLPPSDTAQTFLGIALMRDGAKDEAQAVLSHIIRTCDDPALVDMARQTLG